MTYLLSLFLCYFSLTSKPLWTKTAPWCGISNLKYILAGIRALPVFQQYCTSANSERTSVHCATLDRYIISFTEGNITGCFKIIPLNSQRTFNSNFIHAFSRSHITHALSLMISTRCQHGLQASLKYLKTSQYSDTQTVCSYIIYMSAHSHTLSQVLIETGTDHLSTREFVRVGIFSQA